MFRRIIHGDSSKLAKPEDFDAMIADPPYSEHVHKNATSQSPKGGTRARDLGFDHLRPEFREWIAFCAANVKRWSLIYSDVEGLHLWRDAAKTHGATYVRPIAWVRWSMPQLSGDRPTTGFELVTCYWGKQKGRKSWNGPGNLTHLGHEDLPDDEIVSAIGHKCLRGEGKHKCEKPLDQALNLVEWFTNPGEKVFDPCAGSGVVGLACKLLGRSYEGYEIDGAWAEKASKRIEDSGNLSERDKERLDRWKVSNANAAIDRLRRQKNTARVRAQIEGKS